LESRWPAPCQRPEREDIEACAHHFALRQGRASRFLHGRIPILHTYRFRGINNRTLSWAIGYKRKRRLSERKTAIRHTAWRLLLRFFPVGAVVSFYFGVPVESRYQRLRLRRRSHVRGEDLLAIDILSVYLVIAFVIIPELVGLTLFASPRITYLTKEKVIHTDSIDGTAKRQRTVMIPRIVAVLTIGVGVIILVVASRKLQSVAVGLAEYPERTGRFGTLFGIVGD
jgi:hypothetical protein